MSAIAAEPARIATETVAVDGVHTRYLSAGEGDPVVLLHGSGPGVSAATNWSRTIPALAERFWVLAPEMLGFGGTDRAESYTIDAWVDHLTGFLDALGLQSAHLVGNSLGGVVTLHTARRHPERIRRMVLMGAPGLGMRMTPGLKALRAYEPTEQNMRDLLTGHFAFDPALVDDALVRDRYQASAIPGELENYRAIHRGQVAPENVAFEEDWVGRLNLPALLVHGREDQVIDAGVAWTMAGLLPDAELHVFPRCGHWAQLEHADRFNRLVGDFLAVGGAPEKPLGGAA